MVQTPRGQQVPLGLEPHSLIALFQDKNEGLLGEILPGNPTLARYGPLDIKELPQSQTDRILEWPSRKLERLPPLSF